MSTENTQSDVGASVDSAESSNQELSQDSSIDTSTQDSSTDELRVGSLDDIKKMSKDGVKRAGKGEKSPVLPPQKEPTAPVPPAYEPNFKYKAALQEKEIEEFWRPLIKDLDSEKRVKDLLTKVDGFDFVKASREKLEKQFESLNSDYQTQNQVVQKVESAVQRGDLSSVFRQLGVTKDQVFRWTQSEIERLEMPPDQRKAYEDAERLQEQQLQMQEQMSQYQRMYEQQAVQARTMQLEFVMSRPEVAETSRRWDELQGMPGAFKNLVIQEAQTAYFTSGYDMSAAEAVEAVMKKFGKVLPQEPMQSQPIAPQVQAQQAPQVLPPQQKPVIPQIHGQGAAPIKKAPRSLDDLKKLQKELQG